MMQLMLIFSMKVHSNVLIIFSKVNIIVSTFSSSKSTMFIFSIFKSGDYYAKNQIFKII